MHALDSKRYDSTKWRDQEMNPESDAHKKDKENRPAEGSLDIHCKWNDYTKASLEECSPKIAAHGNGNIGT